MNAIDIFELINKLYLTNKLTITRIHEHIGIDYETLKKLLSTLKLMGFVLKPDIMISKLGLKQIIVIMEIKNTISISNLRNVVLEIPFIKALSYVPPNKIIVSLHAPSRMRHDRIEMPENVEKFKIYAFDYVIRSKPHPHLLKTLVENIQNIASYSIFNYISEVPINIDRSYLVSLARFDLLDLKILSKLTKDPFMPLSRLSKELSIKTRRLEAHVRHAEQFIYGYRLAKIGIVEVSKQACIIVFKCTRNKNLCGMLIRHPCIVSCSENMHEKIYCIIVRDLGLNLATIVHNVIQFLSSLGCELLHFDMYFLNKHFYVATTIASTPTPIAYVPQLRNWSHNIKLDALLRKLLENLRCS